MFDISGLVDDDDDDESSSAARAAESAGVGSGGGGGGGHAQDGGEEAVRKTGYLVKKPLGKHKNRSRFHTAKSMKRRFFVLRQAPGGGDASVAYSQSEATADVIKGVVHLTSDSTVETNVKQQAADGGGAADPAAASADISNMFVVRGAGGVSMYMIAETAAEMDEWAGAIREAIAKVPVEKDGGGDQAGGRGKVRR
jgi:hypothetical protein